MKEQSLAELLRRADELLREQTALVEEFQKLKLELLKRNREIEQLHEQPNNISSRPTVHDLTVNRKLNFYGGIYKAS